jgi:DNA polymerase
MLLDHQVPGEGPLNARVIFVAEAPGAQEVLKRRPMVGYAGMLQQDIWTEVGLRRIDFRLENVCERRGSASSVSNIPLAERRAWELDLQKRAKTWEDPWLVVPVGSTALHALTGLSSITKYRGSILAWKRPNGKTVKIIPTFHPMVLSYRPDLRSVILADWRKIKEELEFRDLDHPTYVLKTSPSESDIVKFGKKLTSKSLLAIDIETPGGRVKYVGFSADGKTALVLDAYTQRASIQWLLRYNCDKVLQNGPYDVFYLIQEGYKITRYVHDTMDMHHVLYPRWGIQIAKGEELKSGSHSLEFQAAMHTRQPPWKDYSTAAAIQRTNGIDVCVTWMLAQQHLKTLRERGLYELYERLSQPLIWPRIRMMLEGIPVNVPQLRTARAKIIDRLEQLREKLESLAGYSLWGAKGGLSNKKLQAFLYRDLKLPRQYNRKRKQNDGTLPVTADETALCKLRIAAERTLTSSAQRVIALLLRYRKNQKLLTLVNPDLVDRDGVIRCSYSNVTKTLRFSSRKNPRRTGMNLQNVDRTRRQYFVPTHSESGWLFLELDLSQAEERVTRMLTRDPSMIKLARTSPAKLDVHTLMAADILNKPAADVTKDEREVGKTVVHAARNAEGAETLSDTILKELGLSKSIEECNQLLARAKTPPLLAWHAATRRRGAGEGILATTWGWHVDFSSMALDYKTFHEMYGFVPQAEVAILLNQWGLIPADIYAQKHPDKVILNAQVHDSLLLSVAPDPKSIFAFMTYIREHLERPRVYFNEEMTIPVTFSIGKTWAKKTMHEWKTFPTLSDVKRVVKELK